LLLRRLERLLLLDFPLQLPLGHVSFLIRLLLISLHINYRQVKGPGSMSGLQSLARSRSPDSRDAVGIEGRIHADDGNAFDLGLGNQQSVERVFVMPGERFYSGRMSQGDVQ